MNHARYPNRSQAPQRGHQMNLSSVPTVQSVVLGAQVSIVLKQDQPTGRQVQGTVAELLTKGNHPRGIKVRLQDGRVGRVQRMEALATVTNSMTEGNPPSSQPDPYQRLTTPQPRSGPSVGPRRSDYRLDGFQDQPPSERSSLSDYVVIKTRGKKVKKRPDFREQANPASPVVANCPVCGEFEGDEDAVAHHVNSHFE